MLVNENYNVNKTTLLLLNTHAQVVLKIETMQKVHHITCINQAVKSYAMQCQLRIMNCVDKVVDENF